MSTYEQGRKAGLEEAAQLLDVLELADPSGLSRKEQLRILDTLTTAAKHCRALKRQRKEEEG